MDCDKLIEDLKNRKLPKEETIVQLCASVKEMISKDENIVSLQSPIVVCFNFVILLI